MNNSIVRQRFWMLLIVRGCSLALTVYGSICVLYGMGIGVAIYGNLAGLYQAMFLSYGSDNWSWLWFGVALVIPGVAMMVVSRRIVRWLVPIPRHECPQCGYAMRNLTTNRCPECGLEMSEGGEAAGAGHSETPAPPANPRMPAR
jgi:hypothetical protein